MHCRPRPLRLVHLHNSLRLHSTRTRNLAARHWALVRAHTPASAHPATRHVVDHEATKAAIVEHTGLRATIDVQPISINIPKDIIIGGVKIPQRPKPPESDECCMSGCAVCVYDLYLSSLDDYKSSLRSARAELQSRSVPLGEWPDAVRKVQDTSHSLDELDLDPSMKAFLILEKKLGQSKG